jgi:alkylation response protein AidB-like acyl-CoA dehydrogenase
LIPLDIVGPASQALPQHHEPLLSALAAAAAHSDRHGVPRSTLDALAASGLLGRPLEPPPALQRELVERLFMADGSLTFCWLQHQMPLRRLLSAAATAEAPAASELQHRWLEPVASGRALAAVACAHLRRPGPPNPATTRLHGGWRLDGELDWITSWDIADLVLICGRCGETSGDRVVGLLLPAGASGEPLPAGLHLGEPLQLLAMGGTHTRPVRLKGVDVPNSQVLFVEDFARWSAADALTVCRVSPMVFGCMRGAIADLYDAGSTHGDTDALALAQALAQDCRQLRRDAYALIDESCNDGSGHSPEVQQRHHHHRAQAFDLAMHCAQSALIACAGAAMRSGGLAERRFCSAVVREQEPRQSATTRHSAYLDLEGRTGSQPHPLPPREPGPNKEAGGCKGGVIEYKRERDGAA